MTRRRGFTLLEVMIGLALLGFALTILIKSTAGSIATARSAQMMGVVTDLSRGKMYDIEEVLLKDGFTDTDQSEEGRTFEDEGWPSIRYSYKVEQVELPSFDQLQAMATGQGSAAGSGAAGAGSGEGSNGAYLGSNSFQDSALGGMLSMFGGGFTGGSQDADSRGGASFIQGYYSIVQEVMKVSIRKVTLTVTWEIAGSEQELKTVAYFTDAAGMDKALPGILAGALSGEDAGSGSGSGSGGGGGGSNSGSGSGSGRNFNPGGGGKK